MSTPLAIYSATAVCDRCQRDGDLITDGHRAYAVCGVTNDPASGSQSDLVSRDGTIIEVTCTAPSTDRRVPGDLCGGYLRFDLSEQSWRSANADRLSLLNAGQVIQR